MSDGERLAALEERQAGHEKTCDARYKSIDQKQDHAISKIDRLHEDVRDYRNKIEQRVSSLENVKIVVSGKVIAGLVMVVIGLLGVVGFFAAPYFQ